MDNAVWESKQDDWENNSYKTKRVKFAIKEALADMDHDGKLSERVLELVKNQKDWDK